MENNSNEEYVIQTFGTILSEIAYAYEEPYPPELWYEGGKGYFNVYKLTIVSDGTMEYKGNITKYNPKLWPKIELLAKVITDDPTVTLLYLNEN